MTLALSNGQWRIEQVTKARQPPGAAKPPKPEPQKAPDLAPELAEITQQILDSRRLLTRSFSTLIQEGIEAGEFHSNVSPEDAALALVGFMNGMGLIWVQDPEHFSIKQRAEVLVDTFLTGIIVQE